MPQLDKIKDLTHEAINLLEVSYCCAQPARYNPASRVMRTFPAPFEIHFREIQRLCNSREKALAQILANVTTQLAIIRTIPIVVVTTRTSPLVCVVNLLLWRAEIELAEVLSPNWGEREFINLTFAAGSLASAPLLIASVANSFELRSTACAAVTQCGVRHVVLDYSPSEAVSTLKRISGELDVPVTVLAAPTVVCNPNRRARPGW